MSESTADDHVTFAGPADTGEMAQLARDVLPFMGALHDDESWRRFRRFGQGKHASDQYTLVVRNGGPGGHLVGFVWVDPAMLIDHNITEPWWCINALAIAPDARGQGRAAALLARVEAAARAAGIVLLYGQSVPEARPFWQKMKFSLGNPDEAVRTRGAAMLTSGERVNGTFSPSSGDSWFLPYLTDVPGSVRSGLLPVSWTN